MPSARLANCPPLIVVRGFIHTLPLPVLDRVSSLYTTYSGFTFCDDASTELACRNVDRSSISADGWLLDGNKVTNGICVASLTLLSLKSEFGSRSARIATLSMNPAATICFSAFTCHATV